MSKSGDVIDSSIGQSSDNLSDTTLGTHDESSSDNQSDIAIEKEDELRTDKLLEHSSELAVESASCNSSNYRREEKVNGQNNQNKVEVIHKVEAEEELYTFRDSWEITRPLLKEMPIEKVLLSHVINLLICLKYLEKKRFAKYQKYVIKEVSAFKGNSTPRKKEFAFNKANDAFENLKAKMVKSLMDDPNYKHETNT